MQSKPDGKWMIISDLRPDTLQSGPAVGLVSDCNCCCCNQVSQIKVLHASINDQTGSTRYIQAHTFQGSFTKTFQRNHTISTAVPIKRVHALYTQLSYTSTFDPMVHLELSQVLLFAVFSSECRKQLIAIQICALLLTYSKPWKNTHPYAPQRNVTLTWVTVLESKPFIFSYLITVQGGHNSLHRQVFFTLTCLQPGRQFYVSMRNFWVTVSLFTRKKLFQICVDSKVICDPDPDDFIKEEFHLKSTLNNHKTQVQLPI